MLVENGATVDLAATLEEASDLLAANDYDGAILDINIRGEKSYPVARQLVERRINFIFATGYGADPQRDEFADILTISKPYSFEAIRKALNAHHGAPAKDLPPARAPD